MALCRWHDRRILSDFSMRTADIPLVKKSCRGLLRVEGKDTNVASILLHHPDAMPRLVTQMRTEFGRLSAVLFESNHPSRTSLEDDSMPPHKRLGFFRRMGARRIPFDYVQPPLEVGKGPVENLMLYCFPQFQKDATCLPVATVMQFLMELTSSLDEQQDEPVYQGAVFADDIARTALVAQQGAQLQFHGVDVAGHNLLQEMYASLLARAQSSGSEGPTVNLTHVPLGEEPRLKLSQAAVVLHAALDECFFTLVHSEISSTSSQVDPLCVWLCLPDVLEFDGCDGVSDAACVLEAQTTAPSAVGLNVFGRVQVLPARLWLLSATISDTGPGERLACCYCASKRPGF